MSTRIYVPQGQDEHLWFSSWLAERIPDFGIHHVNCMACYQDDKLVSVVGFSKPHFNRIEMSWASDTPSWLTRKNILAMLAPAFLPPIKAHGITAIVERKNMRVRKFLHGIGFKMEGKLRQASRKHGHLMVYGMILPDFVKLVERWRGAEVAQTWVQYRSYVNGEERRNELSVTRAA